MIVKYRDTSTQHLDVYIAHTKETVITSEIHKNVFFLVTFLDCNTLSDRTVSDMNI